MSEESFVVHITPSTFSIFNEIHTSFYLTWFSRVLFHIIILSQVWRTVKFLGKNYRSDYPG